MPSQRTRRAVLSAGSALAATGLAGCSALPGYGPESEDGPDAGTDSYGVVVANDSDQTFPVTVTARPRGGDAYFQERIESTPEEDHEWDQVLTGDGMHVVEVTVHGHDPVEESQTRVTVVVGSENSPEVADVLAIFEPHPEGRPYLQVGLDYRRGG